MNQYSILKMAREAMQSDSQMMGGTYFTLEVSDLERFAALVLKRTEYDDIHTCHAECQRPACVAMREAVKAERDRCILILERLHEQVGDRHNYYAHAAKVLQGEI